MHAEVVRVLVSEISDIHQKIRWVDEWILEGWSEGQICN